MVKEASNLDMENIITPVDVNKLEKLLNETGFNVEKTRYLVEGFREGFSFAI